MTVYRDTAAHTHESVQRTVAASNSFVEKCEDLDKKMEGVERMTATLTQVEDALTALESRFDERFGPRITGNR